MKLAQSISKRNFPSVDKPLTKGFEKYKPRGLFSEFYSNYRQWRGGHFSVFKHVLLNWKWEAFTV